jgi:hypothetical protein
MINKGLGKLAIDRYCSWTVAIDGHFFLFGRYLGLILFSFSAFRDSHVE